MRLRLSLSCCLLGVAAGCSAPGAAPQVTLLATTFTGSQTFTTGPGELRLLQQRSGDKTFKLVLGENGEASFNPADNALTLTLSWIHAWGYNPIFKTKAVTLGSPGSAIQAEATVEAGVTEYLVFLRKGSKLTITSGSAYSNQMTDKNSVLVIRESAAPFDPTDPAQLQIRPATPAELLRAAAIEALALAAGS